MNQSTLFDRLLQCTPAHLDAIAVQLRLSSAFLPGPNEPVATRAKAILDLIAPRGAAGRAALQAVLDKLIGGGEEEAERQRVILILAANPVGTDGLALDREVKLIKQQLDQSDQGRKYRIESEWAVSATDLSRFLLKHRPLIVHFSGHGNPSGEIVLEGDHREPRAVSAQALVNLFSVVEGTEAVVLNACYSTEQGAALAKKVPNVIGMSRAVDDDSAVRFAEGFYRGVAFDVGYEKSFRLGCAQIDLAGLPGGAVPHYLHDGIDIETGRMPEFMDRMDAPTASPVQRGPSPARTRDEDEACLYQVWYGTNRRPNDPNDPARGYSAERDEEGRVHCGTCKVRVPKSHRIGSIGSAWWKRWLRLEDDRLKVDEIRQLDEVAYWRALADALAGYEAGSRRALVFIHGFNVSFEEAALRAAQIGVDLKVPGITAFYSWPSKGSLLGYAADEASIEASEPHVSNFLTRLAAESGAERVDVLAHSMGNRALLRTLQRVMTQAEAAARVPFGQLLLAAPDVDADVFRNLSDAYARLAQRTTLYVSSKDRALASSGIVHDHPRAGYSPPVVVTQGIDTVEVSNIDLTLLGHGYYAAARDVLHDMHDVLVNGALPAARLGLITTKTLAGQVYWKIGA